MKRNRVYLTIVGILLLISTCVYFDFPASLFSPKVITVGFFSDSYWEVQNGYSHQILNDAIAKFQDKYPDVKIEYESGIQKEDYSNWLSSKILSDDCPDVFVVLPDDLNDLAEAGLLQDLSKLYSTDESFSEDSFYEAAFRFGELNGVQYGLPYECAPRLMLVNKTILDELNIKMPENDWTWNDLYEICLKIAKTKYYPLSSYTWQDAFTSNNVELFDDTGSKCDFVSDNIYEALLFLDKLNENFDINGVTTEMFENGDVAFEPLSFAQYRAYKPYPLSVKKFSNFDLSFVVMPSGYSGDNNTQLDTVLMAMSKTCSDKNLAYEFMKTLCLDEDIQKEIFTYSEGISPLISVTNSEEIKKLLWKNFVDTDIINAAMSKAKNNKMFKGYTGAYEQVNSAVNAILEGNGNLKTEQIIYNRKINAYLSE